MQNIPQQININITENDVIDTLCKACGGDVFYQRYRQKVLPGLSPKNPHGKDMPIDIPVKFCDNCKTELGKGEVK